MDKHSTEQTGSDSLSGFLYALAAYVIWGMLPLYMNALKAVSPLEVLVHRALWSVPVSLLVLAWLGRTADLRAAFRSPRTLAMSMICALLITSNWLTYVIAVTTGHALDAALGYYINPLFSILLGSVLLGERLRGVQWLALALVAIGVAILTWENGRLPLVGLMLTLTWAFYAYFKKSLPIGPNQGFALEVLLVMPFALALLVWLMLSGRGIAFGTGPGWQSLLLFLLGIVTAVPLMLYANGAKKLRLTTIALMQYISPTMIFLIAVFVFDEPFSQTKLVAFGFIWAALVIYSLSSLGRSRG
ncbi:EamA family transporter RarD [Pseudogemmobacter faecipullorum]|uniref:EamA family transporter RarD n=1 Tax=Pseudogemmobacter faecipullorum TaxID=2755041 RepID=A0ABS8CJ18_9RHOB|nr:EamA family transporter RarD [Pseudogemmobacter faecipullorum]MCB5409140.1 EamA family transporter RarD [Pseudogemmobacter faecipullorum]